MGQVDRVLLAAFLRRGVLLRQHEAYDLAQLHVLQEELHVHRVGRVLAPLVGLVLDEVVLGEHLHVGVVEVDVHRPSQGHGNGPVTGEERPPYPLP